jgi:tRNA(Ile)-lysidine synthase
MMEKVFKYIREKGLIKKNDHIIAGVSGGADSVCLLLLLIEMKREWNLKIHVVHVHHGIGGKEADEDAAFVEKLCKEKQLSFSCHYVDIPKVSQTEGISCEEAGRQERYRIFNQVMKEKTAYKIAVAHNLNDNSETILWNLFRGTHIKGLGGIAPENGVLIRPILCLTREEIEEWLEEKEIDYRKDSTNDQEIYTRNRIRKNILKEARENINFRSLEHIAGAGEALREIEEY